MDHIRQVATAFRSAIVASPRNDLPTLRDFPRGSCGDASILLGQYLFDTGHGLWVYAGGERETDLQSHAWLERGALIVDITANQFTDVSESVIVTCDRGWHKQFSYPEPRNPARISDYDTGTQNSLWPMYRRVQAALDEVDHACDHLPAARHR